MPPARGKHTETSAANDARLNRTQSEPFNADVTPCAQASVTSRCASPESQDAYAVLLVEDDSVDAEAVQRALPHGYAIDHVTTLDQAVQQLEHTSYALIVADLRLPDAANIESVLALHAATPNTPLVVVSALEDEELAVQAVRNGAQDYLVKSRLDPFILRRSLRYSIERKRTEQQLAFKARHDSLTGLVNRVTLLDSLERVVEHARENGDSLSLLFVDLDRFKGINDTLGHAAGDALLCEVARRIRECVRKHDTVARLGGDEFVIVLPGVSDPGLIREVCGRLHERLAAPCTLSGHRTSVSASIGVASYPTAGRTPLELLEAADRDMYRSKRISNTSRDQPSSFR